MVEYVCGLFVYGAGRFSRFGSQRNDTLMLLESRFTLFLRTPWMRLQPIPMKLQHRSTAHVLAVQEETLKNLGAQRSCAARVGSVRRSARCLGVRRTVHVPAFSYCAECDFQLWPSSRLGHHSAACATMGVLGRHGFALGQFACAEKEAQVSRSMSWLVTCIWYGVVVGPAPVPTSQ